LASIHNEDYSIEKKIITDSTIGKDITDSVVKVLLSLKTPNMEQPYFVDIEGNRMMQMPVNKWDKEALLAEDISTKINIKAKVGEMYKRTQSLEINVSCERSEEMKSYAKNSKSWRKCDSDRSKETKLSEDCNTARTLAFYLDTIKSEISLPTQITRNRYMTTLTTTVKAYFLPYISLHDSSYNRRSQHNDHFEVITKVIPNTKSLTVSVSNEGRKTVCNNVRVSPNINYLLPISLKEPFIYRLSRTLTNNHRPSSCSVENNRVSTFDKLIYDYNLNNCEHVIFKDCTHSPKVMVTVKKTTVKHIVKVIIDGNKYELEMNRGSRGSRSNLGKVLVNGLPIQADVEVQGQPLNFQDAFNQISLYQDGVYEIFSLKYGLTVRADSEAAEVKTFQHRLRNLVCGLCGDLNDEVTNDLMTAEQCVMSLPRLAAYSYMVMDSQCAGIPARDKVTYQEETSNCIKKAMIPSPAFTLFSKRQNSLKSSSSQIVRKHLDMEHGQMICISVNQVKICPNTSSPSEVDPVQMGFFCMTKDQEGQTLQKMAQSGERISQARRMPTSYIQTVYVPKTC